MILFPRIGRAALLVALASPLIAASAYEPRQDDRPELIAGDEPGFQRIFDGRSLEGWDGNPAYWHVEDGALVGEITPTTLIRSNTFIIWRGGRPRDFELKLEYRVTLEGNSGINYRSARIADPVTPGNAFAMRGYQFDLDGHNRYTGNNYEEKGRLFLAERGQLTHVVGGRTPILLASIGSPAQTDSAQLPGWNAVHVIVRGNVLIHSLNGRLLSVVIDDDETHRLIDGEIGVQVHVGPPMKVEFRNIRLKNLAPATPGSAR